MASRTKTLSAASAIRRIAGVSAWADQVRRSIELVAARNSSVLIMGPSGTGKELIARAIHACSGRATKPFIPVDCAVTTGTLFASHMFGHLKGSFTGATSSTLGCFRAADGGTIFLDEIGEMELELQAKLLRVLQQRTVVPVGSHQEIPVDVRVLAATNRDLSHEVGAGRFREDLFYRLNVVAIQTLPLRDRVEDIPVLAERYLAELAARHGMPLCSLSAAAIGVLQSYQWPGNVRELENVLERAVMFSSGDEIDPDSLTGLMGNGMAARPMTGAPAPLVAAASRGVVSPTALPGVYRVEPQIHPPRQPAADGGGPDAVPLADDPQSWPTLADVERLHLERTLAATMHNKSQAAKMLGIDRSVLRRKLQRYGLDGAADRGDGDEE
jgi:DNA-binding NtrC family response regulator